MKRFWLSAIFVFCISMSVNVADADPVTLKGAVVFRDTGEPLAGVRVYLDGTSTVVISDSLGCYSIQVPRRMNTSLVFRHLDYKLQSVDKPFEALPDTVSLDLRSMTLAGATIYPSPYDRTEMINFFKRQFLGTTEAGRSCVIDNLDDIRFIYNPANRTLSAASDNPLIVHNDYLGYTLLFDLRYFTTQLLGKDLGGVSYTVYFGTCLFDDTSGGKASYRKRRDAAYGVSFRALINSMVSNDVGRSDFFVINSGEWIHDMNQMKWAVADTSFAKTISIQKDPVQKKISGKMSGLIYDEIKVQYKKEALVSAVYFLSDRYMVDHYGNIDNVPDIIFTGNMSMQKVGDMLPLDYIPSVTKRRKK